MSPNVGNFVHDLVEMAKAMETLPQVQAENSNLKDSLERAMQHNLGLESNIIGYKQRIEELHAKVRSLEVERDDASFRVLEAEDKAHGLLSVARTAQANLSVILATLDPPKPQPEPVVDPVQYPHAGHGYEPKTADVGPGPSEVPPIQSDINAAGGNEPDWKQDQAETSTLPPTQPATSQGQGEVNPMTAAASGDQTQASVGTTVSHSENASSSGTTIEPKPSGPYTNKRYYDHPTYVPLWDWIDGGGTEESYLWRPASL